MKYADRSRPEPTVVQDWAISQERENFAVVPVGLLLWIVSNFKCFFPYFFLALALFQSHGFQVCVDSRFSCLVILIEID